MIKIDKNIPITKLKGNSKYPFKSMEINDSFFLKATDKTELRNVRSSVCSAVRAYNDYHKKTPFLKVTSRQVDGGIRFWRIK